MADCPDCGEYVGVDDLSTNELLHELNERLTRLSANPILWGKKEIKGWIKENYEHCFNLADQQKNEIFEEARNKYTIAELTERLK